MSYKAWIRDLQVHLTSTALNKKMVFGSQHLEGKNDLDITVTGTKYMSFAKDQFTIRIKNLTYAEVLELVVGKYYKVEIFAGYKDKGAECIFDGSVIYMSYQQDDPSTNTIIILAGSKLVAQYGQSKMNMTLNSGINMYSALKFLCKRAGIKNSNIDDKLKYRVLQESLTTKDSIGNTLENFLGTGTFVGNSDGTDSNVLSLFDSAQSNARVIILNEDNIVLVSGYPKLNSDGLSFSTLPLFNFKPLDVIVMDASIIDISVESYSPSEFNNANWIDPDSKYMITQISYNLTNRSQSYYVNILAKARSLFLKS